MAPSPKKSGAQTHPCEISLQPLNSCLVNLPARLCSALENANTVVQNVIAEIVYRPPPPSTSTGKQDGKQDAKSAQKSIYVGWTGMESKKKLAPLIGRDGIHGASGKEQDVSLLEIDSVFGRLFGLTDGQKVQIRPMDYKRGSF